MNFLVLVILNTVHHPSRKMSFVIYGCRKKSLNCVDLGLGNHNITVSYNSIGKYRLIEYKQIFKLNMYEQILYGRETEL